MGLTDGLLDRFKGVGGSLVKSDGEAAERLAGFTGLDKQEEEGLWNMFAAVEMDEGAEGEGVLTVRSVACIAGEGQFEACGGLELAWW